MAGPSFALPDELKGKSAEEIAQYYVNREKELNTRHQSEMEDMASRVTAPAPTPTPTVRTAEPTLTEWWNNPAEATRKLMAGTVVSREEFDRVAGGVQGSLIETARMISKDKFQDFPKFEQEIRQIINSLQPFQRTDPIQWETAYYYVKGRHYDTGVEEARTNAGKLPTERTSPISPTPPAPVELSAAQKTVAAGLGLTEESFKTGMKNMEEGKWPLTMSTMKPR